MKRKLTMAPRLRVDESSRRGATWSCRYPMSVASCATEVSGEVPPRCASATVLKGDPSPSPAVNVPPHWTVAEVCIPSSALGKAHSAEAGS
jgi:hypothetical protein